MIWFEPELKSWLKLSCPESMKIIDAHISYALCVSSNLVAEHIVRSTDPKDAQPKSAQNVKTTGSMMDGHEVFVRAAGVSFRRQTLHAQ